MIHPLLSMHFRFSFGSSNDRRAQDSARLCELLLRCFRVIGFVPAEPGSLAALPYLVNGTCTKLNDLI